jgi:hypothetical protein
MGTKPKDDKATLLHVPAGLRDRLESQAKTLRQQTGENVTWQQLARRLMEQGLPGIE